MPELENKTTTFGEQLTNIKLSVIEKNKKAQEQRVKDALSGTKNILLRMANVGHSTVELKHLLNQLKTSSCVGISLQELKSYLSDVLGMTIHQAKDRPGVESDYIQW